MPSLCTALLTRGVGKPMLAMLRTNNCSDSSKTGHGSGREDLYVLSTSVDRLVCLSTDDVPIGGKGEEKWPPVF